MTKAADHAFVLRPSDYTAALLQAVRAHADAIRGARALDMGCGSGVLAAALAQAGAASVCGVDIEDASLSAAKDLIATLGCADRTEIVRSDLWSALNGRRFEVIIANLPHFPMRPTMFHDRLESWGYGGEDGRAIMDRFLKQLKAHLEPGGLALITHNAFIDLERTKDVMSSLGLGMTIIHTWLTCIAPEKMAVMNEAVLRAQLGLSIHRIGSYVFGEAHVLSISRANGERDNAG